MATAVSPTLPAIAPQPPAGATSAVVLQPGTVVDATVLKAAEDLVQIAIAGLAIDVLSEVPLSPGQNLQLAVSQTLDGTICLAVVGEGTALGAPALSAAPATAPPNDPLTPLERIAVSVATENAATHQQSLAPLFANLDAVAALHGLPPAVGQAVAQVLAQQTGLDQNLTGDDVQNALAKSGLFLEASLAAGVLPSDGGLPDLKAALIVLRQTAHGRNRHGGRRDGACNLGSAGRGRRSEQGRVGANGTIHSVADICAIPWYRQPRSPFGQRRQFPAGRGAAGGGAAIGISKHGFCGVEPAARNLAGNPARRRQCFGRRRCAGR